MADPAAERTRAPADGAAQEPHAEVTRRAAPPPRRGTSFFFKLLGLPLVVIAGWWAYYSWRQGRVVDPLDPGEQRQALGQAERDVDTARHRTGEAAERALEASRKAMDWAAASLADLRARIHGKPPESREEVSALVAEAPEAEHGQRPRQAPASPPGEKGPLTPTLPPSAPSAKVQAPAEAGPLAEARAAYRLGQEAYAMTDPSAPAEQIQKYLALARPHFERCMSLLDQARAKGAAEGELESLEQRAVKRLYDIQKRTVLKLH